MTFASSYFYKYCFKLEVIWSSRNYLLTAWPSYWWGHKEWNGAIHALRSCSAYEKQPLVREGEEIQQLVCWGYNYHIYFTGFFCYGNVHSHNNASESTICIM